MSGEPEKIIMIGGARKIIMIGGAQYMRIYWRGNQPN
jgi:hypothetical protein